jgi:alkylhydroperoxidase family enzyme
MIRYIIHRKINRQEKLLGASMDYLRYIVAHSLGAFFAFTRFFDFARYRDKAPRDALAVAHLVAAMQEDCGACVQIAVNMARMDGVPEDVIAAVLSRAPESLPESLRNVHEFAVRVAAASCDEAPWREALLRQYGEPVLIELSFAIAAGRVWPTVKRGLGFAVTCGDPRKLIDPARLSGAQQT